MTKNKHSELPWRLEILDTAAEDYQEDDGTYEVYHNADADMYIMRDAKYYNEAPSLDDAKLIVKAVNNHNALINVIRELVECGIEAWGEDRPVIQIAQELLNQLEKEDATN